MNIGYLLFSIFFPETVSLQDSGTHQLYRLAVHQATGTLLLSLFPCLSSPPALVLQVHAALPSFQICLI